MQRLGGIVQHYAWGSLTALGDFLGRPSSGAPEAEFWMGAHPAAPSPVVSAAGEPALDSWIEMHAAAALGPDVQAKFGARLPFLFKVLAAGEPLSLQAHPSMAEAQRGFAREEAAGIALDAPNRSYRDPYHKPELICAVTPFAALCGVRPLAATIALLEGLEVPALAPIIERLVSDDPAALADVLDLLLRSDRSAVASTVAAVEAACRSNLGPTEFANERSWAVALAEKYPGDPGVLTALLLNLVELEPGEAIFLGAGNLHAYLGGLGVEIMAASDNVLRGGLTSKFVDVDALLSVVDASPLDVAVQRPQAIDGVTTYDCPVPEFGLQHIVVDGPLELSATGPEIILCVDGKIELRSDALREIGRLRLGHGDTAFVPYEARTYCLSGSGILYRAVVGHPSGIDVSR